MKALIHRVAVGLAWAMIIMLAVITLLLIGANLGIGPLEFTGGPMQP